MIQALLQTHYKSMDHHLPPFVMLTCPDTPPQMPQKVSNKQKKLCISHPTPAHPHPRSKVGSPRSKVPGQNSNVQSKVSGPLKGFANKTASHRHGQNAKSSQPLESSWPYLKNKTMKRMHLPPE